MKTLDWLEPMLEPLGAQWETLRQGNTEWVSILILWGWNSKGGLDPTISHSKGFLNPSWKIKHYLVHEVFEVLFSFLGQNGPESAIHYQNH